MPERPDLEYQVPILARELVGRHVVGVKLKKPVVWRSPWSPDVLVGREIRGVARHGHFVDVDVGERLAIHPMLAGRFSFEGERDLAVAFQLDDGRTLRFRDSEQMAKVYLLPSGQAPPGWDVGVDVLGPGFTEAALARLAKGRREQVKAWLLDKAAFDSFGNAYADEALWEARLHPKTMVASLSKEELARLRVAMVKVLAEARDEIARRKPPLDEKLRDFLKVRNRAGEPCPRCGETIRAAGVHGHDAFFCPTCQPDVGSKGFVDWRRVK
ncbi:MAG: DNA-formamidopyrimidine glycosylase family protein [Myxococcota bacterium]